MKLRHLVVLVAASVLILACARPTSISVPISHLKLIDVHNHLPRGLSLDNLIKLMDETGVQMTVLMPVFYERDKPQGQGISDEKLVLDFYQKRPDRIIPFFGMQRPVLLDKRRWEQPDTAAERSFQFAESQLSTGSFRGIGEFILCHYSYSFSSGAQAGTIRIPADTPLMKRFLDLAAKYHVPVTIHYEIDEESLPSLKKMLEYGRRTTIILAHNGGRPALATLQSLLEEYPNLLIDWAGMNHFGAYGRTSQPDKKSTWFVKNPIEDGNGHLRPEWKVFSEQYQDRIVGIGVDGAHPEFWVNPEAYKRSIATFRSMLSDLSPEAAEKIAFKNAQKLFGLTLAPTPASTTTPTSKCDESEVGIVLMHGKWAGPPSIQGLTKALIAKGFNVITPVMPWGLKRLYDADYPTALSEIEASVEILRKKGAKRIIVAGQSFGANASIAYAASGREVDGVIAIAPGHCPDLDNFGASVAKARQMIAEGKAEETASFDDNPQGQHRTISTTAKIYLSFFDPDGLGVMPKSAAAIPKPVPFLCVVGTHDRIYRYGENYVFNKVPKHPRNKYLVVNADHASTPVVAASQIVEWIMSLKY